MGNIIKIKCNSCGGECENGICLYCGDKDLEGDKIKKLMQGTDDIEKYYEEKIRSKLLKGIKLNKTENKIHLLLLKNDMICDEGLEDGIILKHILCGNQIISYENFEELMIRSAERTMRMLNDGRIKYYFPKAFVVKMDDANGSALDYHFVQFNELIIKELYKGYIAPLTTYFHEMQHILQAILFHLGYVSCDLMIMLKERIIKEYEIKNNNTNYYYKDNYYNISYEVDAHQTGIDYAQHLLSLMGFINYEDYLNKIRKTWPVGKNNLERVIRKGEEKVYKTVDEIFDNIIIRDPSYLDKFPQLKLEYAYENGVVRKRNEEELTNMMMGCLGQEGVYDYLEQLMENRR